MRNPPKQRPPLDYYLGLTYPVVLHPEDEGGYSVEIKELPGCLSQGDTADEALEMIEDARQAWIEVAYEHGADIPLPSTVAEYSGKVLVRMPRSLHRKLVEQSSREGVSLNQTIVAALGQYAGFSSASRTSPTVGNLMAAGFAVISNRGLPITTSRYPFHAVAATYGHLQNKTRVAGSRDGVPASLAA